MPTGTLTTQCRLTAGVNTRIKHRSGKASEFSDRAFCEKCGFRTYLVNKGATQAELESAAFWMRHSNETAKENYTKQKLDEKLAPGAAIATKLNSELLRTT